MTHADAYYHTLAAAYEGRVMLSGHSEQGTGRAWQPLGVSLFRRMGGVPIQLDTPSGPRWTTEAGLRVLHQVNLLALASATPYGDSTSTMTDIAARAKVSVSTVSRQMCRFMAWGIIGYATGRGRYGGVMVFARTKGDGLDHYARQAWASIKAAAERRKERFLERLSRSGFNLASYERQKGEGVYNYPKSKGATLKWDELADALRADRSKAKGRLPCPAHGDHRKLTLAYWWRPDGSLGLKCWQGCTFADIKESVGL